MMEKFYMELTLDTLPIKDVRIRIPFTHGPCYDIAKLPSFKLVNILDLFLFWEKEVDK